MFILSCLHLTSLFDVPFQILLEKQVPSRPSTRPTTENSTCQQTATFWHSVWFEFSIIKHSTKRTIVKVLMHMKDDHCLLEPLDGYNHTQSIHRTILLGHDFSKAKSILYRNSKSHQNLKPISELVKSKVRG